jgi:hypothetical protein
MLGKVLPARVHFLNQSDLFFAPPAFELLLASYRFADFAIFFVVHQARASVFLAETLESAGLVLHDPSLEKNL